VEGKINMSCYAPGLIHNSTILRSCGLIAGCLRGDVLAQIFRVFA
jgi:hypothetical protein